MLGRLKREAKRLKNEVTALAYAQRHPDTPWAARAAIICVVAYALSPIDLIPDFIPVLGLLDDLILLPRGIYLALKLVPEHVMLEARAKATTSPPSTWGALIVVLTWLALFSATLFLLIKYVFR